MADQNLRSRVEAVSDDVGPSEIRRRRLFGSARDGILLLDPITRKITDANPFMVELLGYSRDELRGKELWEIGLFKNKDESQIRFNSCKTWDMPCTKTGRSNLKLGSCEKSRL